MVPELKTAFQEYKGSRTISPLSPGPLRSVILDFDGTLTDVEKETEGYAGRYREGLAKAVGIGSGELCQAWDAVQRKVQENPSSYGWKIGGRIVAPAASDPHILVSVVASEVLDSFGLLEDPAARAATLDFLFHANYRLNPTVFKEGAAGFLGALMERAPLSIATSSRADSVRAKLSSLGLPRLPDVYGEARKNILDQAWDAVPESVDAGLGRPVYLRRRFYHDVLERITSGLPNGEVLVAGDIYELDLSLPQFLGMRTALLPKASATSQEIGAVLAYGKGLVCRSLEELFSGITSIL